MFKNLSPCILSDKVEETRDFYIRYFNAKVTFDCGWYVNLQLSDHASELQFMAPQAEGQSPCNCAGLTYNIQVENVDAEHQRLLGAGLSPCMPLEDHPWGDRGFAVEDPNGIVLYLFHETEPSEEFRAFYK